MAAHRAVNPGPQKPAARFVQDRQGDSGHLEEGGSDPRSDVSVRVRGVLDKVALAAPLPDAVALAVKSAAMMTAWNPKSRCRRVASAIRWNADVMATCSGPREFIALVGAAAPRWWAALRAAEDDADLAMLEAWRDSNCPPGTLTRLAMKAALLRCQPDPDADWTPGCLKFLKVALLRARLTMDAEGGAPPILIAQAAWADALGCDRHTVGGYVDLAIFHGLFRVAAPYTRPAGGRPGRARLYAVDAPAVEAFLGLDMDAIESGADSGATNVTPFHAREVSG